MDGHIIGICNHFLDNFSASLANNCTENIEKAPEDQRFTR